MNYATAPSPLHRKRMEIAHFKREMKKNYVPRSWWPMSVRAKYDAMKEEAHELQGAEEIAA